MFPIGPGIRQPLKSVSHKNPTPMMTQVRNQQWLSTALCSLGLLASATLSLAQNTNPTNTFDLDGSAASFVTWWGPPSPLMTWDGTLDAGGDPNSGSVRYEEPFTGTASEQFMTFFTIANRWGWDGGYVLNATTYTNFSFDIKVDPSSGQRQANNDYGPLEVGLVTDGWGTIYLPTFTIPLSATNWTHVDRAVVPSLANIDKVVGYFFKMWSNGAHTNSLVFNIDNVMLTKPTVEVEIPPPTLGLRKAGSSGVEITMDNNSSQWQRDAISTPAGGGPYMWTSQGSYPVTYSLTITNFPDIASHDNFEAHMYLVNGDTSTAGDQTSGSPDWGVPDIFIFRVENNINTVLTTNDTTITTNFTYDAYAQIQWKTNHPAANATNIPATANGPSVVGTWTVTFLDSTTGTLSGPGITPTNFTIPEDVVLNNFSPATSFLQFGIFKNDGANDGHNNQASGTFSHVKFTGTAAPFEDNFNGPALDSNYAWRKTSATAVQHIAPGTAWWLDWTLPDAGFTLQSAAAVTGPWGNAGITNSFTSGGKRHASVLGSALPGANANFFRLLKRPFTKLQVLMPGEVSAPNTVTGKTGTPTELGAFVPFNVVVNAVDDFWNIIPSSDMINITSSDASATLPADNTLVSGTRTFSVTFNASGTFTVTATDVTDGTKTANTGTAVIIP